MKKVVSWVGGRLGNILFCVASGKYYADTHNADYYILRNGSYDNFLKKLESGILKDFNVVDEIDENEFETIYEKSPYHPIRPETSKNTYIDGYREAPRYWNNDKEFIYRIFKPEPGIIDAIKSAYKNLDLSSLACINIRRGDYLKDDVRRRLGLLKKDYFERCIAQFPKEKKFLIVSDDILWCRDNFTGDRFFFADKTIVGYDKMYVDLWIQTLCSDNIIANSTFSWWGAYLNRTEGRKVYYPYPFFKMLDGRDKIPLKDNWIKIPSSWDERVNTDKMRNNLNEVSKKKSDHRIFEEFIPLINAKCKKVLGHEVNFVNPTTIQDKLNWLKVYDSTPLKTRCADKIQLRGYCKEKLGKDICVPIIAIYNKPEEIEWDKLPDRFVIKCNHGSGMNIIVTDKKHANKADINEKLHKWLEMNHATRICYEMHYEDIEKKIFVEKYIGNVGEEMLDYKFWCFNGVPEFMTINDGNGHGVFNTYDMNFKVLDMPRKDLECDLNKNFKKPINFIEMKVFSEKLSQDFKFVRVDFYEVNGKLYLGELTFIPGAGLLKYKKVNHDLKVGSMLKLSDNKKVIYTSVTGKYDVLEDPEFVDDYDFICFTDDPSSIKSDVWQVYPMPDETIGMDPKKAQRYVKLNPHKLLKKYDVSIYVDANIELKINPDELLESLKGTSVSIPQHPSRDCLYKEAGAVIKIHKDKRENVEPQMERYKKEGFPENYGLTQNNIIIRWHNEPDCIKLMETWWNEVKNNSYRDQLSFSYARWKCGGMEINVLNKNTCDSKYFHWRRLHGKRTVQRSSTPVSTQPEKKKPVRERPSAKVPLSAFTNTITSIYTKKNDVPMTKEQKKDVSTRLSDFITKR